ncbi:acyl-CoA reductase (LuxC) [Desulfosporosinus acididurans]|uniref:Acyl-CoA reductase (LuxC) n=1 Tax=Desulfosporosinus acididurans TaxID=476652 RepID=A0A0J1IME0_9FIRM|nr:acyl-CoA reductase [Desulfosporosinus acididurans]KLU65861.1 acyl-CoA reductase (LuxC) [Desulfosporosinus acididurans]
MNGVNCLAGTDNIVNVPARPYNGMACEFAYRLSSVLMHSKEAKEYSDIMSFAFWCRKANITKLKENYGPYENRLGRGLTFHIAPSNIPVNFSFSWMFSLLAGNSNIVRVSSKPFPQVQIICRAIEKVFAEFPTLKERNAIISYPANSDTTSVFSAMADARVIWGGDETIKLIKAMPSKPRCVDITFADRYSIAIINGEAIIEADEAIMNKLAERFYNDTYLMDQNACSSPQTVFWLQDSREARERFWGSVKSYVNRHYILEQAAAMDKYSHLCEDIIEMNTIQGTYHESNLLYRIDLVNLPNDLTCLRGKNGYFYEFAIQDYRDLIPFITEKYQTMTYFGLEKDELQNFVIANEIPGIDRIVPIGDAMDIDVIWDGYDLVGTLSRIISAK